MIELNALAIHLLAGILLLAAQVHLLFFHRHQMGTEKEDSPQDRFATPGLMTFGFLLLIGFEVLLALDASLPLFGFQSLLSKHFHFSQTGAALALGLVGYGLRVWAIRTLGRFFTFQIGIRAGHRVIQNGPYRLLRHPSYTGFLILLGGFALWTGSIGAAALMWVPTLVALTVRIIDEETMLRKAFGNEYEEYSKRTFRLFPGF